MGGEVSTPTPPTPPPPATLIRDFDRCFILFGKGCSGKSTLGNLLLWSPTKFKIHDFPDSFGLTKEVQSGDAEIHPRIVYGEDCKLSEPLKIQILDQPGTNDSDFSQENLCEFLMKCIAESKGEMCANFLILINLKSPHLSNEECLTIMNIAEILSNSSYSFFPNAAIVFTHADKIDVNLNEQKLKEELKKKMEEEDFTNVKELIELVEGRYIFINGANHMEENRHIILKKLFSLTRSNICVYVNGNNRFRGKELKMLLGSDPDSNSFRHNFFKYDVEYHFNPDLNLFRKYEKMNIEEEIAEALNKLSGISKRFSVIILLVSLEEMFNKEIYDMILNLPTTYNIGDEFKKDFWDYSCILFKTPNESEAYLRNNLDRNDLLRDLVSKVKSRFCSIGVNNTSPKACSDKILNLVRRVKSDTEGKTYIESSVLAEMKRIIDDSAKQRKSTYKTKIQEGVTNLDLIREGIPIFRTKTGPKILVAANNFFWSREWMTPQIGYFILKNINQNKAKEFKEKYKHQARVKTEEFAEFCLEAMKDM